MLALDEDSFERRSLARNELLFRQGDKVRAIYFIEGGGCAAGSRALNWKRSYGSDILRKPAQNDRR
jgi:hypothetical protein